MMEKSIYGQNKNPTKDLFSHLLYKMGKWIRIRKYKVFFRNQKKMKSPLRIISFSSFFIEPYNNVDGRQGDEDI